MSGGQDIARSGPPEAARRCRNHEAVASDPRALAHMAEA
jgi:hypothetical protein